MKKRIYSGLFALVLSATVLPHHVWAEEDTLAQEEAAAEQIKDRPEWTNALKTQYKLTDEQVKSMQDKGLNYPQMAMTSALAEKSGKSIDEVMKMRLEDKMGWGKIAKELGVPPKEIGKSVSSLRHEIRDERNETKELKREARKEKREEMRQARREEKQEKREERQAKREAKREQRGNKSTK